MVLTNKTPKLTCDNLAPTCYLNEVVHDRLMLIKLMTQQMIHKL